MTIELIYWDSDAFLGWLQEEAGKVGLCQGTIERAKAGEVVIVTSTLTLAEVLRMRGGPREDAQGVVWKQSIRPKDAIHVATALAAKCPTLETFDEGLLKQTGTVGTPPLVIRKPIPPKQGRLSLAPA